MNDFRGNEIEPGDTVAYIQNYSNSPDLKLGTVVMIKGQFAELKSEHGNTLKKSKNKLVLLEKAKY